MEQEYNIYDLCKYKIHQSLKHSFLNEQVSVVCTMLEAEIQFGGCQN